MTHIVVSGPISLFLLSQKHKMGCANYIYPQGGDAGDDEVGECGFGESLRGGRVGVRSGQ